MDKLFHRFRSTNDGGIAVIAALTVTMLVGFVGLGVDVGYVYYCQDKLQTTTDAAAIAGAEMINVGNGGTATTTATQYSASGTSSLNQYAALGTTMVPGYPVLKCLTSTGVSCSGPDNANAIEVGQQAAVPTFFARLFGLSSWNISAKSLASARGGMPEPIDVEIVLDTTASMNDSDPSCEIPGATREDCALNGVRTLLMALDPCSSAMTNCGISSNNNVSNPLDRVGLMVFPGLYNSNQTQFDYDCTNSPEPEIATYAASPVYQIVPFSSDYRSSDTATSLSTASKVTLAARGVSTCNEGMDAKGGVGTFYADVINQAQTALASDGRPTARKVIIFISDGGANAIASNMPAGEATNQCHEAITAAQNATAAGTWVYSISYGSSTSTNPSTCTTDTPVISSCSTMQQIASDSTKYFSDTSGGDSACTSAAHPISELSQIFQYIGVDSSTARLLPLNTT